MVFMNIHNEMLNCKWDNVGVFDGRLRPKYIQIVYMNIHSELLNCRWNNVRVFDGSLRSKYIPMVYRY